MGFMKGMGQIVTWSIGDETQHTEGMIELFKSICCNENKTGDQPISHMFYKKRCIKLQKRWWFRRSVYRSCFKKYKDEPVNDDNDLETKIIKSFLV